MRNLFLIGIKKNIKRIKNKKKITDATGPVPVALAFYDTYILAKKLSDCGIIV